MSRRKGPRDYFEPWTAAKSSGHGKCPFPAGIPEGFPREAGDKILDAWTRADRDAEWVLWGSRMAEPAICKNLDGTVSVTDDRRIIAVRRTLGLPDGAPQHEDVAKRITACVNACAAITDPEKFIKDVRALLLGYTHGECVDPRADDRVVSLLGRCIPPEELGRSHANED